MESKFTEQEHEEAMFGAGDEDDTTALRSKYLFFNLGEDLYGINIMHVTEIVEIQPVTEVPDMPSFIKGVINLRGKVIPVMDLRLRFGMPYREYDNRTCIIIAEVEQASLGLIVDTVAEVHDIDIASLEQASNYGDAAKENNVEGACNIGDSVAILIDARKIILGSTRRVLAHAEKGEQ